MGLGDDRGGAELRHAHEGAVEHQRLFRGLHVQCDGAFVKRHGVQQHDAEQAGQDAGSKRAGKYHQPEMAQ